MPSNLKQILLLTAALALAACGGGGSGGGAVPGPGPSVNRAPTANAGPDQDVSAASTVNLDGSDSTDLDGDTLTYSWLQTAGSTVTLSNAAVSQPSFTAPDATAGNPETLTFQLTVSDGSATGNDSVSISVSEAQNKVTVAGHVYYDFVPPVVSGTRCTRLNFSATEERPIRGATVQLLDVGGAVLGETTSAPEDGSYSFADIDANIDVRVRVRAELKKSGSPSWDVEVRDNVVTAENDFPLNQRLRYVTQWQLFNTGTSDIDDADFTADTGWSGSSYSGVRAAAPFAILDAIYDGIQLIVSVDPDAVLPALDAFWSVNNKLVSPSDIDNGELSASFYSPSQDSLFLLGDSKTDAEEFDDHVVMHEWGHYFEDNFSRSDSIGGSHFLGQSLDLRLAFGEGFGHAIAAIALDEQQYCDTGVAGSGSGSFGFSTETNNNGLQGWFNELSVATFLYDLWDSNPDGADNASIGFAPIYATMTGPQAGTNAFTTVFSFATELRSILSTSEQEFLDAQLNRENINTDTLDIWGDGQTTTPSGALNGGRDLTPIYTEIPIGGDIANVCINNDYAVSGVVNKLSDWRYLRFTTPTSGRWQITAQANPVPPPTTDPPPGPDDPPIRDRSDPDLYIWRQGGFVTSGRSGDDDVEVISTSTISAATYVIEMQEWRHEDEDASSDFPSQVCFDLSIVAL